MAGKPPSASEAIFMSHVVRIAEMNGWLVFHPSPHQVRPGVYRSDGKGYPDLTLAHRDRGLIFAELKLDDTKLSPMQVIWANALKPHVEHYVWRPSQLETIALRLGRAAP